LDLIVVGMNHRTAPVSVRERVAFTEDEVRHLLGRTRDERTLSEALVLSTCNRTEVYGLSSDNGAAELYIRKMIAAEKDVDLASHPGYAYTLARDESVRHLLRVAAGLDSLVLGESQILGQVKRAYELSLETNACGLVMNRMLQSAISVGKRVRNETAIGAGAVSVASAASELAGKIFENLADRSVLLIGVGEMGTLTARHMIDKGVSRLTIANRTFHKAERLAAELSGHPMPLERLEDALNRADIVISSTGATSPIVEKELMSLVMSRRGGRPIYVIDIAVPRDFEPAIEELDGVFLHDIDDMNALVDRNLGERRTEIPKAEAIVEHELEVFATWKRSLAATPLIKALREHIEAVRSQELARHGKRFCDQDREELDKLTDSLVNKILHPVMSQVRDWSDSGDLGALRIDTIYEAFALERAPNREPRKS
jgi:glutamyl-tRNA reductase